MRRESDVKMKKEKWGRISTTKAFAHHGWQAEQGISLFCRELRKTKLIERSVKCGVEES
jgi:hypothetical protein